MTLFLTLALCILSSAVAQSVPPADFLVLGGGTAGCAVAAIICERLPNATVTVIERGTKRSATARFHSSAARNIAKAWADPEMVQRWDSAPNPGLDGRTTGVIVGSNIGGSSAVNAARPSLPPAWYFNTLGIAGLTAESSQALFNRVRSAIRPAVARSPLLTDYTWTWVSAAARAGLPFRKNSLERPRTVAGAWPEHIAFDAAGRRVDAYRGFLQPALAGKCNGRLRVVRGATVDRVIFRKKRAVSVRLTFASGKSVTAQARREILLAAGALNTAAVLQRSGVGPAWLLRRRGVPVVQNLPVGEQLQTRHVTSISATYTSGLARVNNVDLLSKPWVRRQFDAGNGGPLAVSAWGPAARMPGLGYMAMRIGFETRPATKRLVTTSLVNPQWNAWGRVWIRSRDAAEAPEVRQNLMASAADVARSGQMVKKTRQIYKQLEKAMGVKESLRAGESTSNAAAALETKVRNNSWGSNHFCGGSAVGPVLNARLVVKGLAGLRVVDSGAIRRVPPNAGPLATVYTVAVRAADIVVEDNRDLM